MVVIEILPDCWGDPIRLACVPRGPFAHSIGVVVGDDDALRDAPRYFLHVRCRETDSDRIRELYGSHSSLNAEGGSVSLAEQCDAPCFHIQGCAFANLSIEELLSPLFIDELRPYKMPITAHRDN